MTKHCIHTFHRLGGIDDCPVCRPETTKVPQSGQCCEHGNFGESHDCAKSEPTFKGPLTPITGQIRPMSKLDHNPNEPGEPFEPAPRDTKALHEAHREIAALKAENEVLAESVRQDYDPTARDAEIIAKLEAERDELRDRVQVKGGRIEQLENYHVNLRTELAKARKAIDHITMGIPSEWAFADMRKQRDEVQAKLDEIILYMPKVPTEPYEKRLARTCEQYKSVAAQLAAACVRNPSSGSCIEALKEYNKLMETKK